MFGVLPLPLLPLGANERANERILAGYPSYIDPWASRYLAILPCHSHRDSKVYAGSSTGGGGTARYPGASTPTPAQAARVRTMGRGIERPPRWGGGLVRYVLEGLYSVVDSGLGSREDPP